MHRPLTIAVLAAALVLGAAVLAPSGAAPVSGISRLAGDSAHTAGIVDKAGWRRWRSHRNWWWRWRRW